LIDRASTKRGYSGPQREIVRSAYVDTISHPSSYSYLSYADRLVVLWQDFLLLVGRIMMGWIFFQSGWGKLGNIAGVAKTFPRRGLAEWLAYISVPAEFFGGLFL
jgi:putative oxidoreductase